MKNVKVFNSMLEIEDYIKLNRVVDKEIGSGIEGLVYLTKDDKIVKYITNSLYSTVYSSRIIMSQDFNLPSFIFPDRLLMYKNLICGYESRYFKGDVFYDELRKEPVEIDLEKLLEARKRLMEDVKVLTEAKYVLDDVSGNILFDGNDLVCIDTLSYDKSAFVTLHSNMSSIDRALNYALYLIDERTWTLDMPFEERVKKLIALNKTSKITLNPIKR